MTESSLSPRSVTNLREVQALASSRLGFSVTRVCPLRCAHCCASAGPDKEHAKLDPGLALRIAEQLPDLAALGVRYLDFTGGEPTLMSAFISVIAKAARTSGMRTGIVTAAHWAADEKRANFVLDQLNDVDEWDISTDEHHLPFVSLATVQRAFEMLRARGKDPLIRIAHGAQLNHAEAEIIDRCHAFAGERIGFQRIDGVGRAEGLVPLRRVEVQSPCPATGPIVQPDGRVAPCCANISYEQGNHPLWVGNAYREDLTDIVMRWRTHPLFQALRVWGFSAVVQWLREDGHHPGALGRGAVCSDCMLLVRDEALAAAAAQAAARLDRRIATAQALQQLFGETWMLERIERALRQRRASNGVPDQSQPMT
jgi:MoaA/NifB/PqqE/SkfB family radical SAM enzyme